jgi:hypothetical protein
MKKLPMILALALAVFVSVAVAASAGSAGSAANTVPAALSTHSTGPSADVAMSEPQATERLATLAALLAQRAAQAGCSSCESSSVLRLEQAYSHAFANVGANDVQTAAQVATFAALIGLKDAAQVAETRSKTVEEISGRPPKVEKQEKVEKAAGE